MPGNGRFYLPDSSGLYTMRASADSIIKSSHTLKPNYWDVFLSYTRRDRQFAGQFAAYLSRRGKRVYFDDWDDDVTEDTPELVDYIRQELEKSFQLAVLLTQNCQLSWWVPLEVGIFLQANDSRDDITAYIEDGVEAPSYFVKKRPLPAYLPE